MHARFLSAVLGVATMFCVSCPAAQACHFRVRHFWYYESGSQVEYSSYYGTALNEPQRRTVDKPAPGSRVVPSAFRNLEPKCPATVAPVRLSTPRVMHFSEMGNNNFPDD
jgi:hypothetical protein